MSPGALLLLLPSYSPYLGKIASIERRSAVTLAKGCLLGGVALRIGRQTVEGDGASSGDPESRTSPREQRLGRLLILTGMVQLFANEITLASEWIHLLAVDLLDASYASVINAMGQVCSQDVVLATAVSMHESYLSTVANAMDQ